MGATLKLSRAQLACMSVLSVLAVLAAASVPAQANPFVYVANSGSDDVSHYDLGSGGLLTPLAPPAVPAAGEFPSSVAVSADGNSVYVANQRSDSVSQYGVAADGTLTPKTPASVAAGRLPRGVVVSPDGNSVYVANVGSEFDDIPSTVGQYDVGPDGTLSPKSPPSVSTDEALGLAVSPDGESVYTVCGIDQCVLHYTVGTGGTLSFSSGVEGGVGFGVAVSPDSQSVYVADFRGFVSQFDAAPDGTLSPKTPPSVDDPGMPVSLVVSPDGRSLYVANQGGVSQYDIAKDGTVSPKTPSSVAAEGAFGVAVSPDGYSAYAAGSAGVSQYDVGRDGALSPKSPATVAAGSEPRSLAVGPARGLTNKSCKHGGWREFGFPKQGACVRFVKRQRRR
jgi:6-phosphogluconolactonase